MAAASRSTPYFALKSVCIGKKNVYQVTRISTSLYTKLNVFADSHTFKIIIGIDT